MILLRNIDCVCPRPIGRRDILIAGGKIEKIAEADTIVTPYGIQVIDCGDSMAFPGIVDQHTHMLGGGGEGGPLSRIREIECTEFWQAGVTTAVGVLGLDSRSKTPGALCLKARELEAAGLTAYIYTGSYELPPRTIMGSVSDDIIFIDNVVGVGEIAISDSRSTMASLEELIKLVSHAHTAGMLAGKAGIVHFHIGEGAEGLDPLLHLLNRTELPPDCIIPTHINRNESLLKQAIKYNKSGGWIDLTAGESKGVPVTEAVARLKELKTDLSRVTVSSDAHGSIPGGGFAEEMSLYNDIRECIRSETLRPDQAIRLVSENVAKLLSLYPCKGTLQEGSDADILITDHQFDLKMLLSKGVLVLSNPPGHAS